jgi:hypothetical protein
VTPIIGFSAAASDAPPDEDEPDAAGVELHAAIDKTITITNNIDKNFLIFPSPQNFNCYRTGFDDST